MIRVSRLKSPAVSTEEFDFEQPNEVIALEALADSLTRLSTGFESLSPLDEVTAMLISQGRSVSVEDFKISMESGTVGAIIAAILAAVAAAALWLYRKLTGDGKINGTLSATTEKATKVEEVLASATSSKATDAEVKEKVEEVLLLPLLSAPNNDEVIEHIEVPNNSDLLTNASDLEKLVDAVIANPESDSVKDELNSFIAGSKELESSAEIKSVTAIGKAVGVDIHIDPNDPASLQKAVHEVTAKLRSEKAPAAATVISDFQSGGSRIKRHMATAKKKTSLLQQSAEDIKKLGETNSRIAEKLKRLGTAAVPPGLKEAIDAAAKRSRGMVASTMLTAQVLGMYTADMLKFVSAASK